MVLWGLTGDYQEGRLVTTADQAGTTALRDTLDALGLRFTYVYDTPDAPYAARRKSVGLPKSPARPVFCGGSRIGMMGYRDMKLHATLSDGVSLRRVIGSEIETFETLEMARRMPQQDAGEVARVAEEVIAAWQSDRPLTLELLDPSIRLYLSVMERVRERRYDGVSLIDVDGVKKLLGFTPAATMMLLSDLGGLATIPENDGPGAVTQLMVRFLTGQAAAYFEFYEFFKDRVLIGVPDYVPAAVVDGAVQVSVKKFGELVRGHLERVEGEDRAGDTLPPRLTRRSISNARCHRRSGSAAPVGRSRVDAAGSAVAQPRGDPRYTGA